MDITLKEITVRELTDGYVDNAEDGVRGYSGLLDGSSSMGRSSATL